MGLHLPELHQAAETLQAHCRSETADGTECVAGSVTQKPGLPEPGEFFIQSFKRLDNLLQ